MKELVKKVVILIVPILLLKSNDAPAKVDPPNYNFSLQMLEQFMPGTSLEDVEKTYGKGKVISKTDEIEAYSYEVEHLRYKFSVVVQFYQKKILDFYAPLPSYFLHNIFHQSLINKYGMQEKYINRNNHGLYVWETKAEHKIYYMGTCTITCFPVYLSAISKNLPIELYSYKPTIETLSRIDF